MLRIGTCGFPVARKRYYEEFSVVEVQKTFYEPPADAILKRWRHEAPEEFEFTIKAWQVITHPFTSPTYRRTKSIYGNPENYGFFKDTDEVYQAWERTEKVAEILQSRIILFQTPASFKPTNEHIESLKNFFEKIKSDRFIFVFELRNWPWERLLEVAETVGFVPVVTEENLDKRLPERLCYIRLHGKKGYKYRYTDEELMALARRIIAMHKETYVFFNNLSMYEDALRLKKVIKYMLSEED